MPRKSERYREPVEVRIDRRLWKRLRQEAALAGIAADDWLEEAIVARIEDATDIRESLAALAEEGEDIPWERVKEELHRQPRRAV